jgi:hypothetical protein
MTRMTRRLILALSIDSAARSMIFIFSGKIVQNSLVIQVRMGEDSGLAIVEKELSQRRCLAD